MVILLENFYRESLFNKSRPYQESLLESHSDTFYYFWKFITHFGAVEVTLPLFAISFLFLPLNSSFTIYQSLIYTAFITNFFKIIYQEKRPYWESDKLKFVCSSGYGNPSGHSCTSSCFYLTLASVFINSKFFKLLKISEIQKLVIKIAIFVFAVILIIIIMLSRVILAAYGGTLGLGVYFVTVHFLSYYKFNAVRFFAHICNNNTIITYSIVHGVLMIISSIVYLVKDEDENLKLYVKENIFDGKRCEVKPEYKMFKNDGFSQSLNIISVSGAHFGILFLVFLLQEEKININFNINEWNNPIGGWIKFLIRMLMAAGSAIFALLNFVFPSDLPLFSVFFMKFLTNYLGSLTTKAGIL